MRPARWIVFAALALAASCGGDDGGGATGGSGGGGGGGDGGGTPPPVSYAVQVAVTGPGAVEVTGAVTGSCRETCGWTALAGGTIALTAVPDEGATFQGWSGACSGTSTCSLTVSSDVAVTGVFEAAPPGPGPTPTFVLTIELAGDGSGTIASEPAGVTCAGSACSGTFAKDTRVKLTATPGADSRFEGWSGEPCTGSETCELVLTAATRVTARFARGAPGTYAVKILSYPGGVLRGAAIDAAGDVAGTFSASDSLESQVFLYVATTGQVTLPLPDHRSARCDVMNDAGVLLVYLEDGKYHRFHDGALLGTLGAMTPMAMNDRGWAVGWGEAGPGPLHAVVDDGTGVRDLDPLGTVPSSASGINAEGAIVGTRGEKAVVFEAGGPRDLPVPPASSAHDVSDGGLVVGAAKRTFKWTEQAFLVQLPSGEPTLIDRPTGASGLSLDRINRAGTVAIGQAFSSDGTGGPVVYRQGKLERLAGLVELPEGVRLRNAVDVNDRGQIVVIVRDEQGLEGTAILTPR